MVFLFVQIHFLPPAAGRTGPSCYFSFPVLSARTVMIAACNNLLRVIPWNNGISCSRQKETANNALKKPADSGRLQPALIQKIRNITKKITTNKIFHFPSLQDGMLRVK